MVFYRLKGGTQEEEKSIQNFCRKNAFQFFVHLVENVFVSAVCATWLKTRRWDDFLIFSPVIATAIHRWKADKTL